MDRRLARSFVFTALLGCTPLALAGASTHAADSHDRDAQAQPAGAATLPPATPPANSHQSGIGNVSDVPGSMSDGSSAQTSNEAPSGAKSLPPILPRSAAQNSGIGNIEDVTGSMGDGSAKRQ